MSSNTTPDGALAGAQEYLAKNNLDGWLLFDFQGSNPVFAQLTGGKRHLTRRCFLLVPPVGEPRFLLHFIDAGRLADCGWPIERYVNLDEMLTKLRALLGGRKRLAMEYSPECALPVVSRVDAGTVEMIRGLGSEVVSSADLIQYAVARWTPSQLFSHRSAARKLDRIVREAFDHIGERLDAGISEADVVRFILARFEEAGLTCDHPPIVAVDAHAGDPHYEPTPDLSARIGRNQLVLIDLWAKEKTPEAVYADITWMGYTGREIPAEQQRAFNVVREARDAAVSFLADAHRQSRPVQGWEADAVARRVIAEAGYADNFTHRLGHSIGTSVHSNGANLDSFETKDTRTLVPGIAFSIEPGIYRSDFGVRTEVDVYYGESGPEVTTPAQQLIVRIG